MILIWKRLMTPTNLPRFSLVNDSTKIQKNRLENIITLQNKSKIYATKTLTKYRPDVN